MAALLLLVSGKIASCSNHKQNNSNGRVISNIKHAFATYNSKLTKLSNDTQFSKSLREN